MTRSRWALAILLVLVGTVISPSIPRFYEWSMIQLFTRPMENHHMNGVLRERYRVKRSGTDNFGDPIRHGPFKEWHDNGKLMLEGQYRNGKLDGPVLTLDRNANRTEFETYVDGRRVGRQAYYYQNGTLRRLEYQRQVDVSTEQYFQRRWRQDGTLNREDGRRPDSARWWDEDVRRWVESLADEVQEWARDWHPNGQIATERHWGRKEDLLLWKEWYPGGQMKLYDNGEVRRTWREDGQLEKSTPVPQGNR